MLETAFAQLRFAYSLALGRPFHTPSLGRLIDVIRETQHEYGPTAVGVQEAEIIGRLRLDDATRSGMRLRRFRDQAKCAVRETRYPRLFAELYLKPGRLDTVDIARLRHTSKNARPARRL